MAAADDIRDFLRANPETVKVEVAEARGSTPRERGAWMLVSPSALFLTIGGGQLEYMAIDRARAMLAAGETAAEISIPLGPEIGQCCGGRVAISLKRLDHALAEAAVTELEKQMAAEPHIYLFGAGHVGNALASALALLPVRPVLVDTRANELERAPKSVETCLTAVPESVVREAPAGSAFVILTHDHSLDFLIAQEALARGDAAYVGMIGSKTKRATFASWYVKQGGDRAALGRLVCPIGKSRLHDKRPAVIASLVAAEIIEALGTVANLELAEECAG
ncbi:MAG: xanthine dehydrogenase accessory protein XdhC [Rhizobiaceae bacterium]